MCCQVHLPWWGNSIVCLVQANAEEAVREMLADFSQEQGLNEVGTVHAQDHMDDGTLLKLAVRASASPFSYGCMRMPGCLPAISYYISVLCAMAAVGQGLAHILNLLSWSGKIDA